MSDNTCRICMENAANLVSVFAQWEETSLVAQIITECTAVQVIENDGLPTHICQECYEQLKNVNEFVKKVRQSDRILRHRIQNYSLLSILKTERQDLSEDVTEFDPHNTLNGIHDSKEIQHDSSSDSSDNDSDWEQSLAVVSRKIVRIQASKSEKHVEELNNYDIINIESDKWLCCICFKQFNDKKELHVHSDGNHMKNKCRTSVKKFACQFCRRHYSSAIAVNAHERKIATIKFVYECRVCGTRILERQKCVQHSKLHFNNKSVRRKKEIPSLQVLYERFGRICCALGCSEMFETDNELLIHAHSVHKMNKIEAGLTYNEGKPIECPVCFKRFKQEDSLERHLRFKYNESSNICTLCGAKFPTLTSLTIHERSHTKEKPFQCEICSRGFGDKQSLKRHYVKHTDDKPFMCAFCGASFKRKRAMQAHMLIHAPGELPFQCEVCEKRFRVKAKMLYHQRTHTGEKPYGCRYCSKSFADFSNRMRHEHSHTGEKPYKCSYCPMGFITKRFLLQHEKSHKCKEEQASSTAVQ